MEKQQVLKIGFIGLGRMGRPMAGRLLDAHFPLAIWNRTKAKTVELGKRGAKVAGSPREVATRSDITITMMYDDAALEAVTFGEDGILGGIRPPSVFIDMSTVSPAISNQIASAIKEQGVKMLRAPVTGSTNSAEEGTLTILVSGNKQAYEKCERVFKVMGKKIFYVGAGEEARYLKLAHNMMVGVTGQMLAEAVTFCEKAGLDWHQMLEVFSGSFVASPLLCFKAARLADRDFTAASTVLQLAKDFDLALVAGQQLESPMPITGLVRQFLGMLVATGKEELDWLSLVLLMEELAGIKHWT